VTTAERARTLDAGLVLALALNSAYLAARHDPTPFYFANVAAHPLLGIVLASRLGPSLRARWSTFAPAARGCLLCFAAASALGVAMLFTGTTRQWLPLLWAHIALAALGAVLFLASLRRAAARPALAAAACALALVAPALRY
jgi:hypothetical protein